MTTGTASNLAATINAEKLMANPPARRAWDGTERRKGNNRLLIVTIVSVVWSLFVSAGAGLSVLSMNDKLEDSCDARQRARTAIRVSFASDPDWTEANQRVLDLDLPAKVVC